MHRVQKSSFQEILVDWEMYNKKNSFQLKGVFLLEITHRTVSSEVRAPSTIALSINMNLPGTI